MIRKLILLCAVLFCAPLAWAQHSVSLSWQASPDMPSPIPAGSGYNVYRKGGSCPSPMTLTGFVKINASPVTGLTITDSTVTPGAYCYAATALVSGAESAPSNAVAAVVPVAPPTNLTITSVAVNQQGAKKVIVTATWTDPGVKKTTFTLMGTNGISKAGTQRNAGGDFSKSWTFNRAQFSAPVTLVFQACDPGGCASQSIVAQLP